MDLEYRQINEILLRRKQTIIIPNSTPMSDGVDKNLPSTVSVLASIIKNVQSYGYMLDNKVISNLRMHSNDFLIDWYSNDLLPILKSVTGGNHVYKCMYPNFPKQVMDADEAELFINAIVHYLTNGEVVPSYEKKYRVPLIDNPNEIKYISIAKNIHEIAENILSSKVSVSDTDVKDLRVMLSLPSRKEFTSVAGVALELDLGVIKIPNKENLAKFTKLGWDTGLFDTVNYFNTATDVLRFMVALSDGDTSLSTPTKFKNINRRYRRHIMDALTKCNENTLVEDMFRYRECWLRIGEIVHPFTFKNKKYKKVNEAFYTIRNEDKPYFFAGKVEKLLYSIKNTKEPTSNSIISLANLLKTRPGEFARRLDSFLRAAREGEYNAYDFIINKFSEVANEVSIPVLLQVYHHFLNRNKKSDRVFLPKGNVAKSYVIDNNLPDLPEDVCSKIAWICSDNIIAQLAIKDPLGKVYIDEDLYKFIVPFSLRNANPASKTLIRGSRIKINKETNILRLFIWWTNTTDNKRVDLDLSIGLYDDNWNMIDRISYINPESEEISCYQSGDIINGGPVDGDGVAEFIDIINLDSVSKKCKYITFDVFSFTKQKFSQLPNCCFGWMNRNGLNDGEIFEPSTVSMKIDIKSNSEASIPAIYDCENREIVWCDMNFNPSKIRPINIESNRASIAKTINSIININKPNLYTLVYLNTVARGEVVDKMNDADIAFIAEDNNITRVNKDGNEINVITPYDIDYFINNMM